MSPEDGLGGRHRRDLGAALERGDDGLLVFAEDLQPDKVPQRLLERLRWAGLSLSADAVRSRAKNKSYYALPSSLHGERHLCEEISA